MTIDRRSLVRGGTVAGMLAVVSGCTPGEPEEDVQVAPRPDPVMVTGDTDVGMLLNVKEFGVVGGDDDESAKFQEGIDAAHASDRTLYIPGGRYTADGLVLRNGSRVLGAGAETSIIHAVPGSTKEAVLQIDQGVLQHVSVEALGLEGADNPGQHGFLARAQRGPDGVSGLWHSNFTYLRIYGFDGAQLWLAGGGTDARDPIQFLTFYNMVVERKPTAAESVSVLMSGQVNQTCWIGGRIDAFGAGSDGSPGVNLKICPELEDYAPGFEPVAYLSTKVGHTHAFIGTTFQQSELGIYIDGAESITFDTCHFEGLQDGLLARRTQGIRVDRSHFANATVANPGRGFCLRAVEGAQVVGYGNMFIGEFGDMAVADGSGAAVQLLGSQGTQTAVTSGLTRETAPTDEVDIGGATTMVLTGGGSVRAIRSSHFPGTDIRLRVADGDVVFRAGDGLHLGLDESVRVRSGGTVGFTRFDNGPDWVLSSVMGGA